MLRKLLKYDVQDIFKTIGIFYVLAIAFAVLARLFLSIDNSLAMTVIGAIFRGASISMMFSIIINNLMRLWARFRNNFYGDEAYLTHTLPVTKTALYASKILTGVITVFVSTAVITAALVIAYYSKETVTLLKSVLLPVTDFYGGNIAGLFAVLLLLLFLEFASLLQCGFTGLLLGHKLNHGKIGMSVVFGFAVYTVTQLAVLLTTFIGGLFNPDIMNVFVTNGMVNMSVFKDILYMSMAVYGALLCAGCAVNIALFKQGVNVD